MRRPSIAGRRARQFAAHLGARARRPGTPESGIGVRMSGAARRGRGSHARRAGSAWRFRVARGHARKRGLQWRRLERIGELAQRVGAGRRHPRLLHARRLGRGLRAHAHFERGHRPSARLQLGQQPRLDLPQPGGERVVRGEQRERAVLDEARLDMVRQVVGQQRDQIPLQRRDLFDARAQRGERVGALEDVGGRARSRPVVRAK
ncbi:hypothetical protein X949_5668 [Burkholderia pseudomallei MSHR5609]|nr:hypothetical protein X977_5562 [Burkholderia pseudomallei MSHR7504]KGS53653.1 hypothetical protein X949_5668 [Burkholderia pseudomallei MSHR5609]KGS82654.1 hypothetical protein X976_5125 [Burkholderia pseudomallei MSHR7500]